MHIRSYQEGDLDQIAALDRACFSDFWSEKNWQGTMQTEQYQAFLLEEAGEAAGFILISYVLDEGELLKVGVIPQAKKRGFGRALLEKAEEFWRQQAVTRAFLEVRASNQPAIHLYEKDGFVQIGLRKNYYDQPREDALIYQKLL